MTTQTAKLAQPVPVKLAISANGDCGWFEQPSDRPMAEPRVFQVVSDDGRVVWRSAKDWTIEGNDALSHSWVGTLSDLQPV